MGDFTEEEGRYSVKYKKVVDHGPDEESSDLMLLRIVWRWYFWKK